MENKLLASFFKMNKPKLYEFTTTLSVEKQKSSILIKQIFKFKIQLNELDKLFEDAFFSNKNLEVNINELTQEKRLTNYSEYKKKINSLKEINDGESFIECKIVWNQFIDLPLEDVCTIQIMESKDTKKLLKNLLTKLKFLDLVKLKHKINIACDDLSWEESNIFNFIDSNQKHNEVKISKNILNLIRNENLLDIKLCSIKNCVPIELFSDENFMHIVYEHAIELIFDRTDSTSFEMIKGGKRKLKKVDIPENFLGFNVFSKTILFIYEDEKSSNSLMSILKNLIFDILPSDLDGDVGKEEKLTLFFSEITWEKILEQLELEYKLYVDEEIKKFLAEKKELIKEQHNLAAKINTQINVMKKNVISNVSYSIGIVLSNIVLKAISSNTISEVKYISLIGVVFSVINLLFFYQSGEINEDEKYEKQIELINKYYPKLYITDDFIFQELKKEVTLPELNELKNVISLSLSLYWLLVIFFLCWSYLIFLL